MAIVLDRVSIKLGTFKEKEVLRDISLKVDEGEFLLITGRNGSGKSTLLQIMGGINKPTSGSAYIDGRIDCFKKGTGILLQGSEDLFFRATVAQELGIAISSGDLHASTELIDMDMKWETFLERSPFHMSFGEKRLLSLTIILNKRPQPRFLLLDEPLVGLDGFYKKKVLDLISKYPYSVVVATHQIEPFLDQASRIVVLEGGRIAMDNRIEDLYNEGTMARLRSLDVRVPESIEILTRLQKAGFDVEPGDINLEKACIEIINKRKVLLPIEKWSNCYDEDN